ncbi:MAG: hypothetical protein HYU52_13555 [Acidobacteria bacterium]|nr:hypothetical protein [Acidobacteriota bacterium]
MTRRAVILAALLFALGIPAIAAGGDAIDRSRDIVVKRALIPSAKNVHGEARWIRRDETTVIQTLLYTPSLRRGIDAMRKKELKAWPASSSGYADSSRYLAMVETASGEALKRFAARSDKASKLQTMAIELAISGAEASFATFALEIELERGEARIVSMEQLGRTKASRAYVARAMRLQAAASFGSIPKELDEEIGKAE